MQAPVQVARSRCSSRTIGAFRHLMQWLADERGEDHAAVVRFNLMLGKLARDRVIDLEVAA